MIILAGLAHLKSPAAKTVSAQNAFCFHKNRSNGMPTNNEEINENYTHLILSKHIIKKN